MPKDVMSKDHLHQRLFFLQSLWGGVFEDAKTSVHLLTEFYFFWPQIQGP
jgi:hypothetical protein